jgi:transcriptional regulator with XRE-family HTH domain
MKNSPTLSNETVQRLKQLAARIQQAMEERGMVPAELARRMGVTDAYVRRILKHGLNISLDILWRFEQVLETPLLTQGTFISMTPEQNRQAAIGRVIEELVKYIVDDSQGN